MDSRAAASSRARLEPDAVEGDDATGAAILDAALATFGSKGLEASSLSEIARAANVSRPTVYARYRDKTHLFRSVLEREFEASLAAVRGASRTSASFEEALRRALMAYFGSLYDSFHDLPEIKTLVYADDTVDVIVRTRDEFRKQLRGMIQEHGARGSIDLERVGMPVSRLVDLIHLTSNALKSSTTRERLRRDLADFARLVARALSED
jgi:AcrR family transcriptional regulator